MRSCKICLFVGNLNGGGAERMMVNLANGFAALGHDVTLICVDFVGAYCAEVKSNVKIIDLKKRSVILAVPQLRKALRRLSPDYLLTTQTHISIAAIIAVKSLTSHLKLIIREATTPSEAAKNKKGLKHALVKKIISGLYNKADGYVAVSNGVKNDIAEFYQINEDRIKVIHNPIVTAELSLLKTQAISHPFLNPDRKHTTLVAVGRVSPVKDYSTLLRTVYELNKTLEVRLIILGKYLPDSDEYKKLTSIVEQLGIKDKIDFKGFQSNPFMYLANSDVFVLSSLYEGMPGALIQAMACGCQCVSTDCKSGPSEVLEGGKLGSLAPVGNYQMLSDGIQKVLRNPVPKDLLIEKANEYNVDRSCQDYLGYFSAIN